MEDFIPEKNYHPEDEYEALESATDTPQAEPTAEPVRQSEPQPAPAQPVQNAAQGQPVYPPLNNQPIQQPAQQPGYVNPAPQAPLYPAYQRPVQPMQQPVQPVQQPAPYPYQSNAYQQNAPIYPQPYGQPRPAAPQPYPQQQISAVQPQPVQQPVQNRTPLSPNPYVQEYNTQPEAPQTYAQPKPATPTGTKVFIIILCALLAMMVLGFIAYIVSNNNHNNDRNEYPSGGFSIDDGGGESIDPDLTPFDGFISGDSSSYTDVEDEITLKADNGETQQRDNDNENSVGEPDENAKNIVLHELPKDKDDAKHTTQSAYKAVSDSVVTVVCYKDEITDDESDIASQGTGTIISADGYIITNAHVIGNSRVYAVNIVMNSGEKYPAKIIGYDTWTDLAVLKIDAKDLQPVTFGDSELIEIGDAVIAIGSPGGEKFQNSLTQGIVSAVDRELTINKYVRYIQSDAAISPGNSGGPLCNIYGQVIGITTAKTIATYYENMSFSIPSATVEEIVGDLMRYGYVKGRTRIGISGTEVSADETAYYDIPAGIVIGSIDESGSLADSDIREGDIITELDGQEITSFQDIYDVLANHKPGDKITIKVKRPE